MIKFPSLTILAFGLSAIAAQSQDMGPFDCVMDPNLVVDLGAPIPGLLAEVLVQRGDIVRAGQPVAKLESSVERATIELLDIRAASGVAIAAQQARLDLIQGQQERIATLVTRNVASADQLEQINAELVTAQALLAQAELDQQIASLELSRAHTQLAQRTITSPIDGIVQFRDKSGGEFISTTGSIMTIAQLNPLQVEAFLPVELYPNLELGMRARIVPEAPFDSQHVGRVISVDQIFDAASGTFAVRLELPNPDTVLPAGHRCLLSFGDDT